MDLLAERIAQNIAPMIPDPTPIATYEGAPAQSPPHDSGEPWQQLIHGPNGTGVSDSVYKVAGVRALFPLSVMCRLTTDATVADRTVALEYRDASGTRFVVAGSQAVVQANGQQSFCWHPQAGEVAWPIEDAALAPLPQQYVFWGMQVALKVWGGVAGDVLDQVVISARFVPERDNG